MQRLNTTLVPLWNAARQNLTEADHAEHRRQVNALLADADQTRNDTIPAHLHRAGPPQRRQVDADDIARLRLGRSLALATRSLLSDGAGNQQLPVAASQGDAMATMVGIREATLQGLGQRAALPAIAVLAQGGACSEHSSVAFELARTLDLPVTVARNANDHGVLVLHPELGNKAVVVDAWTTFPGSCLMEDSTFTQTTTLQHHQPGMTHVSNLNLPMVHRLREQLGSALGPKPILDAMLEEYESSHLHEFDGLTTAHQRRVRLSELTLRESAESFTSTAKRHIIFARLQRGHSDNFFHDPHSQRWQELQHQARIATTPLLIALQTEVREAARHSVQRNATGQRNWSGRITVPPDEVVEVQVEMAARAWPALCDVRLPSDNILYAAADGSRFSTTAAPAQIIAAATEGVIASEALNFPDGYR
jgi:hypothetical protein